MKKIASLLSLIITFLFPQFLTCQVNIIDAAFYSEALDENKNVDIYIPPGYDENPDLYYPVIYFLHGWGGSQNSAESIMFYADSLIREGIIDPVVIVCAHNGPEPFFGSFFMNSPLWGEYETYNVHDLINWIQSMGRAMPYKGYRALMGQSMGGYGCFRYGTLYKNKFRAIAAHGAPLNYDMLIQDYRNQVIAETDLLNVILYNFQGELVRSVFTSQEYKTI